MKKEAELHAQEDKEKRELIEARNSADNLIYASEKALKDARDKISSEAKKEIEEKIEALKKVKDSDNMDDIKNKNSELSQAIQKIGAELYKAAGSQQNGQQKPPEGGQKPEEGEYRPKNS